MGRVLLSCAAALAVLAVSARAGDAEFARRIRAVLRHGHLDGADVSVMVRRIDDGRDLFVRNADDPLTPGSNVKLLTTAAALERLGPDFRFRTELRRMGEIRRGVLRGDLMLVGGGDPNMAGVLQPRGAVAPFEDLADALRNVGIERVAGDLVVDASFFDARIHHPTWPVDQLHLHYCAPVSGLALNHNCVDVRVAPAPFAGEPAVIRIDPLPVSVEIENHVVTSASASPPVSTIDIQWREDPPRFRVRGRISRNSPPFEGRAPVRRPVWYAAEMFRDVAERRGVEIEGSVRLERRLASGALAALETEDDPGGTPLAMTASRWVPIAAHESSLRESVRITNEESHNFHADQILKTLGRARRGEGSFESGTAEVLDFLRDVGCDVADCRLVDGSGLSRENRVPARLLVDLLEHMLTQTTPEVSREFFLSLPVSGIRGSLDDRLRGAAYRGRVAAKTGYVSGASALSGYARTRAGHTCAFAILMNGFRESNRAMKRLQDSIARIVVDEG